MAVTEMARGQLPPVTIDCNWCGHQGLTRARAGQKVRCQRCKHDLWVKRWDSPPAAQAGPDEVPVCVISPANAPDPPPWAAAGENPVDDIPQSEDVDENVDEDEGDETCVRTEDGLLVLAEWTEDGRLIPAQPQLDAPWDEALRACGWPLAPAASGCQVIEDGQPCGGGAGSHIGGRWYPGGQPVWVCSAHRTVLCATLRAIGRERGIW